MRDQATTSISIDLDGVGCYHAIHGLPRPQEPDPVYRVALPRFLELMDTVGARATLFAVGRDAAEDGPGQRLRGAVDQGHEVANHSYAHEYRLIQLPHEAIEADLRQAHAAIEGATGQAPCGFRAPGYNTSEAVFDALEALGYLYDSSIFPTPAYFAARALAIGYYDLRGQPSRSLRGDPRQFLARRRPYRPRRGRLHRPGRAAAARALVELPISVVPVLRVPYIGTALVMLPEAAGALLTRAVLASPGPVNLELHGVDFLDRSDPGVSGALSARQRDLQVPAAVKLSRLRAAIARLVDARPTLTLRDLARR